MMPPANDTAEHSQVTAADCQQKHKTSTDGHMAEPRHFASLVDVRPLTTAANYNSARNVSSEVSHPRMLFMSLYAGRHGRIGGGDALPSCMQTSATAAAAAAASVNVMQRAHKFTVTRYDRRHHREVSRRTHGSIILYTCYLHATLTATNMKSTHSTYFRNMLRNYRPH